MTADFHKEFPYSKANVELRFHMRLIRQYLSNEQSSLLLQPKSILPMVEFLAFVQSFV